MAAMVLRDGARFDAVAFAAWIDEQADLAPKARPIHLRLAERVPTSPTNKVLTRTLVHEKYRPDLVGGDELWVRSRGDVRYRPFGEDDAEELHRRLVEFGRGRFWDL